MNKQEAAEFLGISVRSLERYVNQGKIGTRYERGKTRPTVIFDKRELEEFKTKLERALIKPSVETTNPDKPRQPDRNLPSHQESQPAQGAIAALNQISAALETVVERGNPQEISIVGSKILLDLKESQLITGLSRDRLRAAIKEGKLKAALIGRGWKIQRSDLERYVERLF